MYTWIWRHLPGGLAGRLTGSLVLLVGALALLFYVVFPWAEPRLPFNNVNIDVSNTPSATPSVAPTATPSVSNTSILDGPASTPSATPTASAAPTPAPAPDVPTP